MKRLIAVLAGLALGMGIMIGFASQANATISFCKTTKHSPCIGPVNGCHLNLGAGQYAFAETGDSFIDGSGQKFTCKNGLWTKTMKASEVQLGGDTLGRGQLVQGPPGDRTDLCGRVQCVSPEPPGDGEIG